MRAGAAEAEEGGYEVGGQKRHVRHDTRRLRHAVLSRWRKLAGVGGGWWALLPVSHRRASRSPIADCWSGQSGLVRFPGSARHQARAGEACVGKSLPSLPWLPVPHLSTLDALVCFTWFQTEGVNAGPGTIGRARGRCAPTRTRVAAAEGRRRPKRQGPGEKKILPRRPSNVERNQTFCRAPASASRVLVPPAHCLPRARE